MSFLFAFVAILLVVAFLEYGMLRKLMRETKEKVEQLDQRILDLAHRQDTFEGLPQKLPSATDFVERVDRFIERVSVISTQVEAHRQVYDALNEELSEIRSKLCEFFTAVDRTEKRVVGMIPEIEQMKFEISHYKNMRLVVDDIEYTPDKETVCVEVHMEFVSDNGRSYSKGPKMVMRASKDGVTNNLLTNQLGPAPRAQPPLDLLAGPTDL